MDPALAPHYARVQERLSPEEFEARVAKARGEFDGLLDDEALALLVLDELGLNEGACVTLAELEGRAEATVRVTVERVEPVRTFQREGRPPGRVASCLVSDATGEARLTLWDRDTEKTEDGTLRPGVRLTVVNARVKGGRWGTELHVGPWSVLEVEGAPDAAKRKLLADVAPDAGGPPPVVRGRLVALSPTRPVPKEGGGVAFACEMELRTAEGPVRVTVWDELVKAARALAPGSEVVLENLVARPRGSAQEWHSGPGTTLRAA